VTVNASGGFLIGYLPIPKGKLGAGLDVAAGREAARAPSTVWRRSSAFTFLSLDRGSLYLSQISDVTTY